MKKDRKGGIGRNVEEGLLRNRLDLLISLQDTTTGMVVEDRSVNFSLNGKTIRPAQRGNGNFILLNTGRENGLMRIEAFGYEPYEVDVDYEKLDAAMPAVEVFLIPSENVRRGEGLLSFSGNLRGLTSLEAINLDKPICSFREFDPKHKVMTVFMPNRRMNMIHTYYGVANVRDGTYETIEVEKELPSGKIRVKELLTQEFPQNAPICRILHGQIKKNGDFLFRVRDSGADAVYLMKYKVGDTEKFRAVDFHNLSEVRLD